MNANVFVRICGWQWFFQTIRVYVVQHCGMFEFVFFFRFFVIQFGSSLSEFPRYFCLYISRFKRWQLDSFSLIYSKIESKECAKAKRVKKYENHKRFIFDFFFSAFHFSLFSCTWHSFSFVLTMVNPPAHSHTPTQCGKKKNLVLTLNIEQTSVWISFRFCFVEVN